MVNESNRESVSPGQMATLFFSFMTGSSIVNVPGPVIAFAGNAAWISLLLSTVVGFGLLLAIMAWHKKHPSFTLVDCSRAALGRFWTSLLLLPFLLYLTLMVTWIVIGVGGFMTSTTMRNTPDYMFYFLVLVSAAVTVRAGIEVMVRMFAMFAVILLFFVAVVLVLSIDHYHPSFLLPIAPDGLKPILLGSYFTFGFPYAEVVVFTMLLPYTAKSSHPKIRKYMILALGWNSVVLVLATICSLMVFGPVAADFRFPLYSVSRIIDYADFLQRIESVVGISLLAGSYMKATIALYALHAMIAQLGGLQDRRRIVFPLTLVCFLLTITMFESQAEFTEKVNLQWPLINFFCAVVPFLLIAVACMLLPRRQQ